MYRRIASYIRAAAVSKTGNYLVFFPSYRFMEDVYDAFLETECNADVILQSQFMGKRKERRF